MNKWTVWKLAAWVTAMGMILSGQTAVADGKRPQRRIAVQIANYAQVDPETLTRAEEVTAHVFALAGVEATFQEIDSFTTVQNHEATLFVNILSREMAERLGLPSNKLGLAPGTSLERDRRVVYIFDHVAEELERKQKQADKALILGHAIAHEIGHVLLHMARHSVKGMMQANWDRISMQEMAMGALKFGPQETKRIQKEVARRSLLN